LYDFLAIGEKLKLKGLAKTPEHSASQVDPAEDERSRYVQKIDSKSVSLLDYPNRNPFEATGIVKRPWDQQPLPIVKTVNEPGQVRTTRHSYQSNGESMIDKNGNVWTCIVCGKIAADAKTKANLKRHTETHIKGIPWPCNICGKVSGSKSGLAQHKAKYHKDQESAMVVKQQMDPSIPDDCMINSLIEKHGDVWVCTRCGKTATDARTKANLKRHIEVHIEGVSYNCDMCGKTSGSKNGLQQHKAKYHRNVSYTNSQNTPLPIMQDASHIPTMSHESQLAS
jgi:ribosomal protein S27AE